MPYSICRCNKYIDIVSDEAIFRRTILYLENHAYTRIILGQWHTKAIVDYQSTCQVLEMVWFVVDDNVAYQGDRAVKSLKEITWDIISGLSNMTAEYTPYTPERWTRLFNCYSIGEERLNVILKQDNLKREKRVATGRRAKNI
ncbi:hypothetical protein RhiirA4_484022, partial [Rhizophagus irregularis]